MIDRTTLPFTPNGGTLNEGQRFTVRGRGFNNWPSELVLGYTNAAVENQSLGGTTLMKLVSKNNYELVFEVLASHLYSGPLTWRIFGGPFNVPRAILTYD